MTRVIALDAIDDKAFGGEIDFGEQFDLTLVADLSYAAQPLGHQSSGIARSLNGKIEQGFLSVSSVVRYLVGRVYHRGYRVTQRTGIGLIRSVIRPFLVAVDQFWFAALLQKLTRFDNLSCDR